MTKDAFLAALRRNLVATYPWAQDQAKLDRFMASARETIEGTSSTWNKDGEASLAAWREIGGKGPMTYKALRALA